MTVYVTILRPALGMAAVRARDRVRQNVPVAVPVMAKDRGSTTVAAKDRDLQPVTDRDAATARAGTMAEARHLQMPTMTVYAITLLQHQKNNYYPQCQ